MLNCEHLIIIFFIALVCYLIGSIPFGFLIGKYCKKKDLRILGSKNIGSSNAARVLGWPYGIIVFLLDFGKGWLPIFICNNLPLDKIYIQEQRIWFGAATTLGHAFSIFNKFHGGKAIATTVGIVTGICPWIGLIGIILFLIFIILSGYASLASIISVFLVNAILVILYINDKNNSYYKITLHELIIIWFLTIIIYLKHTKNIIRLWNKTEHKFHFLNLC